jgi:hypothetical protein
MSSSIAIFIEILYYQNTPEKGGHYGKQNAKSSSLISASPKANVGLCLG